MASCAVDDTLIDALIVRVHSEPAAAEPAAAAPYVPPSAAERAWHGNSAVAGWALPRLAARCEKLARPGFDAGDASEYLDAPDVLAAKVEALANHLRRARATGAVAAASGAPLASRRATGQLCTRALASAPLRASATTPQRRLVVFAQCAGAFAAASLLAV